MSKVQTAYTELAESLTQAGLDVKDYVPENIDPPLIVINSGSEFLVPVGTYSQAEATLKAELWLHVRPVSNKEALENLFAMLETAINALKVTEWEWTTVGPPTMYSYNGSNFLTVTMQVNSNIELGVD